MNRLNVDIVKTERLDAGEQRLLTPQQLRNVAIRVGHRSVLEVIDIVGARVADHNATARLGLIATQSLKGTLSGDVGIRVVDLRTDLEPPLERTYALAASTTGIPSSLTVGRRKGLTAITAMPVDGLLGTPSTELLDLAEHSGLIDDLSLSREHIRLDVVDDGLLVTDLQSTNGTYIFHTDQ